ncbi:MAG: TolC family protein [Candidatus Omnitrophota bacterium]
MLFLIILSFVALPVRNSFSQDTEKGKTLPICVGETRFMAMQNNLDIKLAQLDSKIKGTELSYKEAIFDTILSGKIDYTNNQLKPASSLSGSKNITNNYNIGIDKKLKSGTDVSVDFTNQREWSNSAFISTNPYHNSQVEIGITQPVGKNFFGLIDLGNIKIVKEEIKNAGLDSYIKIEEAIILAEKRYWDMVLAVEEFRIKKEILKKAIRLFNQYRNKLKIGLVETGDVLASEANMHVRESDLLLAHNAVLSAQEALRLSLNLANNINLVPVDKLLCQDFNTAFIESLDAAFENRRDYMSRKNDIEAKNIKLKMKANSRFPEIDLKATFATNGLSDKYYRAVEGIAEDSNPEYYIGLEFKFPFENNEAESEYDKAGLEKTRAIINLQKTERQVISDVDEAFRKLVVNRANITKMERVENLQKGKLFQEEKRFKYGRSNSDMLIRYQEDLLNAQLSTQKAYFNYRVSMLDLMAAEDTFLKRAGIE